MAKTILLAEDSSDDGLLFRRVLEQAGVQNPIQIVRDGAEAIQYLDGQKQYADREKFPLPKIAFVDLKMPRVDGWAVLAHIKGDARFRQILVVVLTELRILKELQKVYEMGARSFLEKPIKSDDVQELIRQYPDYWVLQNPPKQKSLRQK